MCVSVWVKLKENLKKPYAVDLRFIRIHITLCVGLNYTAIIAYLICNYSQRCEM